MLTTANCFAVGLGLWLGLGSDLVSGGLVVMYKYFCYFSLTVSHRSNICWWQQSSGWEPNPGPAYRDPNRLAL